jgi:transketolase
MAKDKKGKSEGKKAKIAEKKQKSRTPKPTIVMLKTSISMPSLQNTPKSKSSSSRSQRPPVIRRELELLLL